MTKYVLIPDSFEGNLSFVFNDTGHLIDFRVNSWNIAHEFLAGVLQSLSNFVNVSTFMQWAGKYRYDVRKEYIDLSFDTFWRIYNSPRDRFRCEPKWNKLSETKRYLILVNLECYNRYCLRNIKYTKLTPYEYLTAHITDNWDKVNNFK